MILLPFLSTFQIHLNSTGKYLQHLSPVIDTKQKRIVLCISWNLWRPQQDFAHSPSMARSKSSSSGLRLAFYPEHILWERELWSRLRDHIKQWLFVVNKARAACRGPSLSPAHSLLLSFLPLTAHIQSAYHNSGLSDKCAPAHRKSSIPFLFVHKDHQPGSATDKFKFITKSKARWKPKVCLKRIVKTKSPEQLFDCTAWNVMSLCLFIGKCNLCSSRVWPEDRVPVVHETFCLSFQTYIWICLL